ncbi:MAG: VWA domain-containing protein [Vicinamibacterales bacterium]
MQMRSYMAAACVALSLLMCTGQVLPSTATAQERPTFSAESDLVVVHAMVEDGRGQAVPGLLDTNFLVYEDNYPQTISFFSSADAPASIGLLIDNSTSMASKRERVIASVVSFAELSNAEDEIFVLAFNERVHEAWAPRVISESDMSALRATLEKHISARGKTALYDGIARGLERLALGRHARQVLVIVSDGSDNASLTGLDEMLGRTQSSSAMIYTVALNDPVDRDGNPKLLKRISTSTGGESFSPRDVDEVPEAIDHIARDIRATYTLGFVPTNQARDGSMRKLRVVARHPDGRTLKVQTRGGYLAPRASTGTAGGRVR